MASMYTYTDDGFVSKVSFNGMQPYALRIYANSDGPLRNGNWYINRQSTYGDIAAPEFKVFLNDPDPLCFPSGKFGEIITAPKLLGCKGGYCLSTKVSAPGIMQAIVERNGTPGYQVGTSDVALSQKVVTGENCLVWDGKDGLGNVVNVDDSVIIYYDYQNGLVNLSVYDVESHPN